MRKIALILVFVAMLSLIGCVPSTNILDAEFTITRWEQDFYCGGKTYKAVNGEDSYNRCCPDCPDCDSCCSACPDCPESPACPECPTCPCCNLEWGNYIYIDYKVENIGNVDIKDYEVCFTITFKDDSKYNGCTDGCFVVVGEGLFNQAKIYIPAKKVVFVEVESYELQ